jgi:hypothetical protein
MIDFRSLTPLSFSFISIIFESLHGKRQESPELQFWDELSVSLIFAATVIA